MGAEFNPTHEPLVREGTDASRRLSELGVGLARLSAALDAGDQAARQADRFSPVTAAGMLRWLTTVQVLRRGFADDGWEINDDRNSPRVIDPSGKFAIVPVSGTADTGIATGSPKTANPRGVASSRAVHVNGQLEFSVTVALLADMAAEKTDGVQTWFLLYFRSEDDELRAELSLPVRITDKGIVDVWLERIILPAQTFGPEIALPNDAGGDDGVEFAIAAR
jgi:hypothetical protein